MLKTELELIKYFQDKKKEHNDDRKYRNDVTVTTREIIVTLDDSEYVNKSDILEYLNLFGDRDFYIKKDIFGVQICISRDEYNEKDNGE